MTNAAPSRWTELLPLFAEIFPETTPPFRPDMGPDDIAGWSSGRMIELVLLVEEQFDIRIGRRINDVATLGDLARLASTRAPR